LWVMPGRLGLPACRDLVRLLLLLPPPLLALLPLGGLRGSGHGYMQAPHGSRIAPRGAWLARLANGILRLVFRLLP
jgi:hypothetical protein